MQDEGLGPDSPLTRAATITRRAFGQALGMAAVAGTFPASQARRGHSRRTWRLRPAPATSSAI